VKDDILDALDFIPVSSCNYTEWIEVGMALKHEGYDCSVWDNWSKNDDRYHDECYRKWESFNGSSKPITGASIIKLAREKGGYITKKKINNTRVLAWDDYVEDCEDPSVDYSKLKPTEQLKIFLKTLFKSGEYVGYVSNDVYFNKDHDRYEPTKGVYYRTVDDLLKSLDRYPDDLGATIGDWKKEAGAWIRINPLDGKGASKKNVTRYSYCLIESDDLPIKEQEEIFKRLNLPIATMVYSGGKSIHAIVKIDAMNIQEYEERVQFCYDFLKNNGISIDVQNKDPNRLSRMPGVTRNGVVQTLLGVNIGYDSWKDWMASLGRNDDLVVENLATLLNNPPPLAPELLHGYLRKGHKFLLSGASKSGKSFALIELAVALSQGTEWFGFKCEKANVCYINLEIDRGSVVKRFEDVCKELNIDKSAVDKVNVINLRGKAKPLDKLAPELIEDLKGSDTDVIIIDPIYKVITGDENNATEMAQFCNQFDVLCDKLHATVIYAHHHSKGAQGGKTAQDRASGSGVFARDPDALMDMVELELDDNYKNNVSDYGNEVLAYQVECVAREFPKPKSRKVFFKYPLHIVDTTGQLDKFYPKGDIHNAQKASPNYSTRDDRKAKLDNAFDVACLGEDKVHINDVLPMFDGTEKTLRSYIKEFPQDYAIKNGIITRLKKE
jgi:RecA-family ATPase